MSPAGVVGSYPPASQMWLVPSVSVGKLRRALTNGKPVDHVIVPGSKMSTSFEGLGASLPPPITYILLQKLSPRVSPVALGMGGIVPMVLVAGSKLNELVVSTTVAP